jgi:citrate synthase
MDQEFLTSGEAAKRLGVKVATLYAYTSRGLLQSVPSGLGPERRYPRAEVERLRQQSQARRGSSPQRGPALHYGEPVLETRITRLSERGPVYRGIAALDLAQAGHSFEAVAELLWTGTATDPGLRWGSVDLGTDVRALASLVPVGTSVLTVLAVVTAALAVDDGDRIDAAPARVLATSRILIRRLAASLALAYDPRRLQPALAADTVARSLAIALGLRPSATLLRALNRALVLLADHELNASTFAARVAASAGADLYACFGAGLATVGGPRHGGATERVYALIREIEHPDRAAGVVRERLRRGSRVPGFGHVAYRGPDPRCAPLLAAARAIAPRSNGVRTIDALISAMAAADRSAPNVDTAIVALAAAVRMPMDAMPGLFAVARMAGWTAHVLEQYNAGFLIRPRAMYADVETNPR